MGCLLEPLVLSLVLFTRTRGAPGEQSNLRECALRVRALGSEEGSGEASRIVKLSQLASRTRRDGDKRVGVLSAATRRAPRRHIASVETREFVTADKSRRVRTYVWSAYLACASFMETTTPRTRSYRICPVYLNVSIFPRRKFDTAPPIMSTERKVWRDVLVFTTRRTCKGRSERTVFSRAPKGANALC